MIYDTVIPSMKMSKIKLLVICVIYIIQIGLPKTRAKMFEFDYNRLAKNQENWSGTCKDGIRQSPIDINTKYTKKIRMQGNSLIFNDYEKQVGASIKNNGHTVKLTLSDGPDDGIWIKDGGLSLTKFQFAQAHFHWGDDDKHGSEHKIDGKTFPMEMHLVHWNLDVGKTLKEAVEKDTGISLEVLGVHFKIGKTNEKFKHFFDAVKRIQRQNQTTEINYGIRLYDLLPENKNAFYRYKGSLTTPNCNEIVMWTVFKEKVEIDRKQMEIMRSAKYTYNHKDAAMSNNFRDVKLQRNREILDVDTHENKVQAKQQDNSALIGITTAALVSLLLVGAYFGTYFISKKKVDRFETRPKPREDFMSPAHHENQFKSVAPSPPVNDDPPCYVEIDDAKTTSVLSPKLQAILYAQTNGQAS